jgi:bacteriocin-like protein
MNMNHPFVLNISNLEDLNLDFEQLTDEETAQIAGGETKLTTFEKICQLS